MIEISDTNKLPGRRLSVRKVIALHQLECVDNALRIMERNMAEQLVATILEGVPFFNEISSTVGGRAMVECRADCIVLTTDEYAALKRGAFKDGVMHAQGLMMMPVAAHFKSDL